MVRNLSLGIILLFTGGFLITGCNKEYFELDRLSDEVELEPELVAPLVHGSMSLESVVSLFDSSGFLQTFDDGLIYLVYSDTAFEIRADTLVDVPDKIVTQRYIDTDINTPLWLGAGVGDTVSFYKSEKFAFDLEANDRLDSILVKGGQMIIDVESTFKHTGILTISSSQILDVNRDSFVTVVEISEPDGSFMDQVTIPSDGYLIKTEEADDSTLVTINFRLDLINSGSLVDPTDYCLIQSTFLDLDFYRVFGYIDSRDLIDESSSFEIPIYQDNPDLASLVFNDPRINLYVRSSVGIPVEVEMDSVIATSSIDGSTIELLFTEGYPFQIGAPTLEQIGQSVETEININKNTSNIDDLLAAAPSDITFTVKGRTLGDSTTDTHFVLDTSRFRLAMEFLLPMDFSSSGFAFEDTLEFQVGEEGVDTALVKEAEATLYTSNQMPVQLALQAYMLDENHVLVDSLFDGQQIILGASVVDGEGKLVQPTEETIEVTLNVKKLGELKDVRYLRFRASMATSEPGDPVKFYEDYRLDFELSMHAKVKINSREL